MTHDDAILQRVADYYSGLLAEHGATPAGVDWNSDASQRLRFDQLLRVIRGAGTFSLNDYGCGYGALADELDSRGVRCSYHGYDISDAMIREARARCKGRTDRTFSTDPGRIPVADYTVASGIFNVLAGSDATQWQPYVDATLTRMASLSRRGIAFNMLTSYSDPDRMTELLHYADPCRMFDWCKRTLSRNVALLHDYGLYEFTILVQLEERAPS